MTLLSLFVPQAAAHPPKRVTAHSILPGAKEPLPPSLGSEQRASL